MNKNNKNNIINQKGKGVLEVAWGMTAAGLFIYAAIQSQKEHNRLMKTNKAYRDAYWAKKGRNAAGGDVVYVYNLNRSR